MLIEACPAIFASVQASHPDCPSRVRNVCRRVYSTKGRTGFSFLSLASAAIVSNALSRNLRRLEGSMWPLRVAAVHTQPSSGFPAPIQRASRTALTRGVIGTTRRAAAVFPCVTSIAPFRPLSQVTSSHRRRKHASGRVPVSARIVAIDANGSGVAARYFPSSSEVTTRSGRRSPVSTFSFGCDARRATNYSRC